MLRGRVFVFPNVLFLFCWLFAVGCGSEATSGTVAAGAAQDSSAAAVPVDTAGAAPLIQAIAASGRLADLHAPDFSDYQKLVVELYQPGNYAPVWVRGGQPTSQALAVIAALEGSLQKGLNPDDYDASLWAGRLAALKAGSGDANTTAKFDAALTVAAMRYVSDLHIGRVNPKHFQFGIDVEQKKYDLPQFFLTEILNSGDVAKALKEVEPQYYFYQRAEAALQNYLKLVAVYPTDTLPEVAKSVAPGDAYAGVASIEKRLQLLGDLPANAAVDTASGIYGGALVDGVKRFQVRHGIAPDGKLGKDTLAQLNAPIPKRIMQLSDSLERWRWLPSNFAPLPVAVNIPGFKLRVFNPDHSVALTMNVVVGRALRTQTPVFADLMKYIVFRPYWNIPPSIVRSEVAPGIAKDPGGYLARKDFEITDSTGKVITGGAVSAEVLAQLRAGRLMIRQRPGPKNALGLVKFIFPNTNNVYLHSTPSPELFDRSRRDFSHGCVRVQKPAELAAFLLKDQPKWTLDAVKAAMESGPDNQQENLTTPVPVILIYMTAVVDEDGQVYFYDDIYGHDQSLNAVLVKGPPYP